MARAERTVGAGRVAIVTGASSGIGRATARALAARGTTVVAVARRRDRLEALSEELVRGAPASHFLAGDLGERGFAEGVVEATVARHGRLDLLVNNAGVPFRQRVFDVDVGEAEAALRVNFLSCLWTTLAALPPMLRQRGGSIVNVSSFAARVVPPCESVYAATKGAMNAFSEGLWIDLRGSGIHVTLVHPGPIDTEIWDKGSRRSGYTGPRHAPELVAEAILDAVARRRREVTVPRRSPPLVAARLLRLVWPGALLAGMARMDAVTPAELEAARLRAQGREV